MVQRDRSAVRLTHVPTGESVVVHRDMLGRPYGGWERRCLAVARVLLASRLAHTPEPPRPVRTYVLHPYQRVRQGDDVLADGVDAVLAALDGKPPWLP